MCVCAECVNLRLEYVDVRGRNIMLDIILRYSCTYFLSPFYKYCGFYISEITELQVDVITIWQS